MGAQHRVDEHRPGVQVVGGAPLGLNVAVGELGTALGLSEEQARFVYNDIEAKRRTTHYLHARPMLVDLVLSTH